LRARRLAGPHEQRVRVLRAALPSPQLGERDERAADHGRARAQEVLNRRLEQGLRLVPAAPPELDLAVLGAAEAEHHAAAVALRELGDPVAPRRRAVVVEHRDARRDEEAERPRAGDRDR
jgi:hypothetical protein